MNLGRRAKGLLLGWVLPLAVVLVVLQIFLYRQSSIPGLAPHSLVGLMDLTSEPDLEVRFANDAGHTRLLLLVSPT